MLQMFWSGHLLCQHMLLPPCVQTTVSAVHLCWRCYSWPTLMCNTADDALPFDAVCRSFLILRIAIKQVKEGVVKDVREED